METLIDYLHLWEERRPEQTLFRFVDVDEPEEGLLGPALFP
ncbi:hypothetical protein MAHJHV51_56180 [Mycobacterium avium subsp. hominissuis]